MKTSSTGRLITTHSSNLTISCNPSRRITHRAGRSVPERASPNNDVRVSRIARIGGQGWALSAGQQIYVLLAPGSGGTSSSKSNRQAMFTPTKISSESRIASVRNALMELSK